MKHTELVFIQASQNFSPSFFHGLPVICMKDDATLEGGYKKFESRPGINKIPFLKFVSRYQEHKLTKQDSRQRAV